MPGDATLTKNYSLFTHSSPVYKKDVLILQVLTTALIYQIKTMLLILKLCL